MWIAPPIERSLITELLTTGRIQCLPPLSLALMADDELFQHLVQVADRLAWLLTHDYDKRWPEVRGLKAGMSWVYRHRWDVYARIFTKPAE